MLLYSDNGLFFVIQEHLSLLMHFAMVVSKDALHIFLLTFTMITTVVQENDGRMVLSIAALSLLALLGCVSWSIHRKDLVPESVYELVYVSWVTGG